MLLQELWLHKLNCYCLLKSPQSGLSLEKIPPTWPGFQFLGGLIPGGTQQSKFMDSLMHLNWKYHLSSSSLSVHWRHFYSCLLKNKSCSTHRSETRTHSSAAIGSTHQTRPSHFKTGHYIKTHLWTDSQVALTWISTHASRWKDYVTNRVTQIQELTPTSRWRHLKSCWLRFKRLDNSPASRSPLMVDGTANQLPMDLTNGLMANSIEFVNSWPTPSNSLTHDQLNRIRWLMTQVFLSHARAFHSSWQCTQNRLPLESDSSPSSIFDLRSPNYFASQFQISVKVTKTAKHLTSSNFSISWHGMGKTLLGQRYSISHTNSRHSRITYPCPRLMPSTDWQHSLIAKELFGSAHSVSTHSSNLISSPKVVHSDSSTLTSPTRLYGGTQLTLAYTHSYWIVGGRAPVKTHVVRCVVCARRREIRAHQLMGQLPLFRVTASRPFAHTGVDYAGPLTLKAWKGRGARTHRGWICVRVLRHFSSASGASQWLLYGRIYRPTGGLLALYITTGHCSHPVLRLWHEFHRCRWYSSKTLSSEHSRTSEPMFRCSDALQGLSGVQPISSATYGWQ